MRQSCFPAPAALERDAVDAVAALALLVVPLGALNFGDRASRFRVVALAEAARGDDVADGRQRLGFPFLLLLFLLYHRWCARFFLLVAVRVQARAAASKLDIVSLLCYACRFADPEKWLVREFEDLCDRSQHRAVPTFASRRTIDAQTLLALTALCHKAGI